MIILPTKPSLDHDLLAIVRPALDKPNRRKKSRFAKLRLNPTHMLVLKKVPGVGFVHRDRPECSGVKIAKVLLLAVGCPSGVDISQVVVGRQRSSLKGARRPEAGKRPPVEGWRGSHHGHLATGHGNETLSFYERGEFRHLTLRRRH